MDMVYFELFCNARDYEEVSAPRVSEFSTSTFID